jgi:hypothetical protein
MLFRHTYLYIKQHTITGKLYFGKTVRNPITYNGSGTHWVNHINKYGKVNVVTLWYQLYDTTRLEISITYGLNFNCLKSYFLRGKCYKGFYLV